MKSQICDKRIKLGQMSNKARTISCSPRKIDLVLFCEQKLLLCTKTTNEGYRNKCNICSVLENFCLFSHPSLPPITSLSLNSFGSQGWRRTSLRSMTTWTFQPCHMPLCEKLPMWASNPLIAAHLMLFFHTYPRPAKGELLPFWTANRSHPHTHTRWNIRQP